MNILSRWSWVGVLPITLVAGATIMRFAYLERDIRREMGDELFGPITVARIEAESWNRVAKVTGEKNLPVITDNTFLSLSAAHQIKDSRTTLLSIRADTVMVIATGSQDTTRLARRRFGLGSLSKELQKALTSRRASTGDGVGLSYEAAIFSTMPVRGTNWVLLREVNGYTLIERLLLPVLVDILFVASLFVFAFAYVRSRARVSAMSRERELSRVRADFLAAVSHELRTPLAQIRMFAELMRRGSMRRPEEQDRALNVIEKEASRLSILVDNVVNYATMRRGPSDNASDGPHITDVNRDIEYVVDAFAPLANEREVTIETALDGAADAMIDSQALRQILLNFLENAVKYGPRGQAVRIGASKAGGRVRIWVDDQGQGVPEAERSSIWTAFKRGKAAARSKTGGSGIGLSVVSDLVARHGGKVWVEDAPNGGARFVAELDAAPPDAIANHRISIDATV